MATIKEVFRLLHSRGLIHIPGLPEEDDKPDNKSTINVTDNVIDNVIDDNIDSQSILEPIPESIYESNIEVIKDIPKEPTPDDPDYFIVSRNKINRDLYGGIDTLADLGAADIYGRFGNINKFAGNTANTIQDYVEDKYASKDSGQYGNCMKYGWHQETVELETLKDCGLDIYRFKHRFHQKYDAVENPILVFESENLKSWGNAEDPNELVYSLIKEIEVEGGGQRLDRIFGYDIKFLQQLYKLDYYFERNRTLLKKEGKFYLPIPLDCLCNMMIPLTQLKYHEVDLNVKLQNLRKFAINELKINLKFDAIFINPLVNERLKQRSSEIMIKQSQNLGYESLVIDNKEHKYPLNFNHPSMGLLIYVCDSDGVLFKDNEIFEKVEVVCNNRPQFRGDSDYMRYEDIRHLGHQDSLNDSKWNGFYWLPFTRKEDHRDGASFRTYSAFNFSRSNNDNCQLRLKLKADFIDQHKFEETQLNILTINYHILRIMSGMLGLALSK